MSLHRIVNLNRRLGLFTPQIHEYLFLLGAMKCGTTTLFSYLAQHPEICQNLFQKEPEYFSNHSEELDIRSYYRQYFPLPFKRQIALEASTGYTKIPGFPNVADKLNSLPGKKYFAYIVRNPVERIESHMAHNIAANEKKFDDLFTDGSLAYYLAVSRYAFQLDAYRAAFPDHQVLLLDFEVLKTDPLEVVRSVCRHIGIDDLFAFSYIPPQNTRRSDNGAIDFRLSFLQREMLKERLQSDMDRFKYVYGFDVSNWGF
jgi:hypothetical protein